MTDVVVIGAGHNGLVAACYLARAGLSVEVAEAAPVIGGMTTTAALIPEAPSHGIHPGAVDVIFMRASSIVADLELHRHGYRTVEPDPSYAYLDPDGASIAVWRDPRRTAEEIRRFSASDASAYLDFVRTLDGLFDIAQPVMVANPRWPGWRALGGAGRAMVRQRHELPGLGALITSPGEQVVAERFSHPVVRGLLIGLAAAAGPVTTDGSALAFMLLAFLHRIGVGRPVGGMQALVDALASRLAESHGVIRTSSPVTEVLVEQHRAAGVRLADGSVLRASVGVVAACDPRATLERLVPAGTLSRAMQARAGHIPTSSTGAAAMKVDLALRGRVDLGRHHRWRGDGVDLRLPATIVGTPEEVHRAYGCAAAGLLPDDIFFWSAVPTAMDPTQAPDGQDTLYLFAPAMPLRPHEPWPNLAQAAAKAIVAKAASFFDGIEELELGRWVETPAQMGDRLHVTDSNILHVDFGLLRSGPLRPALGLGGYRTPVPGLYLTGAGTHPGAGVSGIPGQLAARQVLRSLTPTSLSPSPPTANWPTPNERRS